MPDSLHLQAEQLAGQLGTTTNDALIRLAEEAAASRARRAEVEALAAARRAAVDASFADDPVEGFLSPEEVRAAVMAERDAQ